MEKVNIRYEQEYSTLYKESNKVDLFTSPEPEKKEAENEKYKQEFDDLVQKIRENGIKEHQQLCELCELLDKFRECTTILS